MRHSTSNTPCAKTTIWERLMVVAGRATPKFGLARNMHGQILLRAFFNWSRDLVHMYRTQTEVPPPNRLYSLGRKSERSQMAVLVRAFSRAFPVNSLELEIIKQLAMFCGAGLLVSLFRMTYGLDLSAGFF